MAEKNEGTLIPKVLITAMTLSNQVSLWIADRMPNKIPIPMAIEIANSAKIAVLGRVSVIISDTFFPFFWNDSLK